MKSPIVSSAIILALSLGALRAVYAGSATWNLNPASGDWNTATNWTPNTVPNGPADVATFAVSNQTATSLSANTTVDSIVFNPGASAFTISIVEPPQLTIDGVGIVNNSGAVQNFVCASFSSLNGGLVAFTGSASAGSQCVFIANGAGDAGASISFSDSASAGSSTFMTYGGGVGIPGNVTFSGNATAANGTLIAEGGGHPYLGGLGGAINFHDTSTAGEAVLITLPGNQQEVGKSGTINFYDSSTAGDCTITNYGPETLFDDTSTRFFGTSTAGNAHITNKGSPDEFQQGGITFFDGSRGCTAGNATIVNEGPTVPSAYGGATFFSNSDAGTAVITNEGSSVPGGWEGGLTLFENHGDAAESTLIANGGPDLPGAGTIQFERSSLGGTARVILSGNGNLDISNHFGSLTIGSVEGEGEVYLGALDLSIGSNNLSTELAAIVQDGGVGGGTGGSLRKLGTGVLTLTGANTYTGGTTVSGGALIIANTAGSGTGTADLLVASGTLGGSGTITGAVTVGTAAFLAPAGGTQTKATLTIQSSLTFSSMATYTYTFRAKRSRAQTDKVVANGVTINSNASFSLSGQTLGTLTQGLVLTVIDNTALTPIAGTFDNLPDGGIVNVNGNNLQASYEGGDGNDLTLTVVQ